MVEYGFSKSPIPKSLSHPLKRSILDAALVEGGIQQLACVYFWVRQSGTAVLRADFCGEHRRGWAGAGMSSLTIYAVSATERAATADALVRDVLPRVVRWLQHAEAAGNVWRDADHQLLVQRVNGQWHFSES